MLAIYFNLFRFCCLFVFICVFIGWLVFGFETEYHTSAQAVLELAAIYCLSLLSADSVSPSHCVLTLSHRIAHLADRGKWLNWRRCGAHIQGTSEQREESMEQIRGSQKPPQLPLCVGMEERGYFRLSNFIFLWHFTKKPLKVAGSWKPSMGRRAGVRVIYKGPVSIRRAGRGASMWLSTWPLPFSCP